MSKKLTTSIVIPNYNGLKLLKKNLPSVIKAKKSKKNRIKEIILVDDGSIDGSDKFVKSKYNEIKVIRHKKNRGFSVAVNTGVRTSKTTLVALLNSDVSVSDKFLVGAYKHFKDKKMFAVSFNEKDYGWAKGEFVNGFVEHKVGGKGKKIHDTFWANGGSAVFRRSMWMKLKGMDSELFHPFYWEDIDLSYRAQKRGWRVVWNPKAKVEHKHESTIGNYFSKDFKVKIQQRNQLLFIWKNITSPIFFRKHIRGLFSRLRKHPGYIRIVIMALKKIRPVIRKRKYEKDNTKVSDEAIFARFN